MEPVCFYCFLNPHVEVHEIDQGVNSHPAHEDAEGAGQRRERASVAKDHYGGGEALHSLARGNRVQVAVPWVKPVHAVVQQHSRAWHYDL